MAIREDRKPLTGKMAEIRALLGRRSLFGPAPSDVRQAVGLPTRRAALAQIEDASIVTADKLVPKPRRVDTVSVDTPAPQSVDTRTRTAGKGTVVSFRLKGAMERLVAEAEAADMRPAEFVRRLVLAHLGESE